MSPEDPTDDGQGVVIPPSADVALVFPGTQEAFAEFLTSVLGKPQTITKHFRGPFEVGKDDVSNFHHLLDQRIKQQNEAKLFDFSAKISYDDDSSINFKSIDDFLAFNEVKPVCSVAAEFTWNYLVKFQDKDTLEKQQIDVAIITGALLPLYDEELGFIIRPVPSGGMIHFRISHTARTWGSDIESLLTGHIKSLMKPVGRFRKFVAQNNGWIGLFAGLAFFLSSVIASLAITDGFIVDTVSAIVATSEGSTNSTVALENKLDFLVDILARGIWPRFTFYLGSFVVMSMVLAVAVGIWVGSMAANSPPSFVILSRKAEEKKAEVLRKRERKWKWFFGSLGIAVAGNLLTNVLILWFFRVWQP